MSAHINKQQAVIETAFTVFYRHGFHATAVDKLFQESGISKRTIYKHFRSKEALIHAAILHYQKITLEFISSKLLTKERSAHEKILSFFDWKKETVERGDYTGCFAINAKVEFEDKDPRIENACFDFAKALEQIFYELCVEAHCKEARNTAKRLMILFDGSIVYGCFSRDASVFEIAKEQVREILGKE